MLVGDQPRLISIGIDQDELFWQAAPLLTSHFGAQAQLLGQERHRKNKQLARGLIGDVVPQNITLPIINK